MKKTIMLVLIFLALTMPVDAYLNEPDGFRGIKWGTPFETVKDEMEYLRTEEAFFTDLKYYRRKYDKLTIDSAQLKSVEYVFCNDKFSIATMWTYGREYMSVYQTLTKEYGQPDKKTGEFSSCYLNCTWIPVQKKTLIQGVYQLKDENGNVYYPDVAKGRIDFASYVFIEKMKNIADEKSSRQSNF